MGDAEKHWLVELLVKDFGGERKSSLDCDKSTSEEEVKRRRERVTKWLESPVQRKMLETVWSEISKTVTAHLANPSESDSGFDDNEALENGNTEDHGRRARDQRGRVDAGNTRPLDITRSQRHETRGNEGLGIEVPSLRASEASDGDTLVTELSRTDSPLVPQSPLLPGNEPLDCEHYDNKPRIARHPSFECFYEQVLKTILEQMEDPKQESDQNLKNNQIKEAQRAENKARIQAHRDARVQNIKQYRKQIPT